MAHGRNNGGNELTSFVILHVLLFELDLNLHIAILYFCFAGQKNLRVFNPGSLFFTEYLASLQ